VTTAVCGSDDVVALRRPLEHGLHLLFDHAVASSPNGVIHVEVERADQGPRPAVCVVIEDTGQAAPDELVVATTRRP
jgi:hypothetical protein